MSEVFVERLLNSNFMKPWLRERRLYRAQAIKTASLKKRMIYKAHILNRSQVLVIAVFNKRTLGAVLNERRNIERIFN